MGGNASKQEAIPTAEPIETKGHVTAEDARAHPAALKLTDLAEGAAHSNAKVAMIEHRHTTDPLFCILIVLCWVAMSAVGRLGIERGNPWRLVGPIDYQGRICGIDAGVSKTPLFYTVMTNTLGVCVDACPTDADAASSASTLSPSDFICLDSTVVPSDPTLFAGYIQSYCQTNGVYDPKLSTCFCNLKYASTNTFRRCRFTDPSIRSIYPNQSISTSYFTTFMQDLLITRNVVFGFGFGIALFFSFFMCHLLKNETLGEFIAWICILGVFILMVCMVGVAQWNARKWQKQDPQVHSMTSINALKAFSGIMVIAAGLFLCTMICLRNAIKTAVKCVSLASTCIEEMPIVVFTPIIQVIGYVIFMIPFVIYCFYIASAGTWQIKYDTIAGQQVKVGKQFVPLPGDHQQEKLWFLYFCMLWTMNFIVGIGTLVIATATAKWYFTEPTERKEKISNWTLLRSYGVVFRFHLGTAAFGSLIIAFVQLVKSFVAYLMKHMKSTGNGLQDRIIKYALGCLLCCLQCLENCVKFLSKNAYIQTAIRGDSFCWAGKNAFFIIARNVFRIGAVAVVSDLAFLFVKLFVCSLATSMSYFYMQGAFDDRIHDVIAPTVMVGIISFITATMFTDVYHTTVDTVLMCFIVDEEHNGGKAYFAGEGLNAFVDIHGPLEPKGICSCCSSADHVDTKAHAPADHPVVASTGNQNHV